MCGIAGLLIRGADREKSRTWIDRSARAMVTSLHHRGPDAGAVEVLELPAAIPTCDDASVVEPTTIALGHRRLSIIDVAGSAQPCFNEDRTVAVTFNGELYNYRTLRQELIGAGHQFSTNGDTEVLVHGWEEWGRELVQRLDGMFAFAVADLSRRRLFAAVDPLGQKPLYYMKPGPAPLNAAASRPRLQFAFASEPRAFLTIDELRGSASSEALVGYLLHDYIPSPHSIFEGIKRLAPGSYLELNPEADSSQALLVERYWQPSFTGRSLGQPMSTAHSPSANCERPGRPEKALDQAAEEFLELLGDAVEKRLMSDVPLGIFLSGGLDSSLLVGLLRERLGKDADLDTFSIGFADASFDESDQAQQTADALGTRHHRQQFDQTELLAVLPHVAAHLDEPFADPSVLPFSVLCRMARRKVTVALGGDGGDELFAGYDPFRAVGAAQRLAFLPRGISALAGLIRLLPSTDGNMPLGFKAERFARGLRYPAKLRPAVWMGAFSPIELERLWPEAKAQDFTKHYASELWAHHGDETAADPNSNTDWHRAMSLALGFFQRRYLPDDILVKVDRASMMHSLEVRSPFLDRQLVEWANGLPLEFKFQRQFLRLGTGKPVARRGLQLLAARAKRPWTALAGDIVNRPKKGFGIPVRRWLRGPLAERLNAAGRSLPEILPGTDTQRLRSLLAQNNTRATGQPKELWSLLMLGLWLRQWREQGVDIARSA